MRYLVFYIWSLYSLYSVKAFATNTFTDFKMIEVSSCAKLYFKKNIPNKHLTVKLEKYNTLTVLAFRFTPQMLDIVKNLYHKLYVPKIIENILWKKDYDSAKLMIETTDYFKWNINHDSFISVNPAYTNADTVVNNLKSGRINSLKNQDSGIALITWYVHPELKKITSSGLMAHEKSQSIAIDSLEKNNKKYLVSILDLDFNDLGYLKDLKIFSLKYLSEKFGINVEKDKIRLDFHFPYAIETATLHLHARVNMPAHPLELSKSFSIDEIIEYLESGKTIKQLILDRQEKQGGFYFSKDSRTILEQISGHTLEEVNNPFLEHRQGSI